MRKKEESISKRENNASKLRDVQSIEENIGIRKSPRFIPILVTIVTILLFINAIDRKGINDSPGRPIDIVDASQKIDSGLVELHPIFLAFQNPEITVGSRIAGGTVYGGKAIFQRTKDFTMKIVSGVMPETGTSQVAVGLSGDNIKIRVFDEDGIPVSVADKSFPPDDLPPGTSDVYARLNDLLKSDKELSDDQNKKFSTTSFL